MDEMQELSLKDQVLDDIPREQVSGVIRKIEELLSYSDKREGMARTYLEERYSLKEIDRAFGATIICYFNSRPLFTADCKNQPFGQLLVFPLFELS